MTQGTLAAERFELWGTVGSLSVTDPGALRDARALVDATIGAVDDACNRFRRDSELVALNGAAGRGPVVVSPMLLELVTTAIDAAESTRGACDPTVLGSLVALGYDRDIEQIRGRVVSSLGPLVAAPGVGAVHVDAASRTIALDEGCALDLGATAKARCADLAAELIASRLSVGCVVDLGGDLRCAGDAPDGGWAVAVAKDARDDAVAAPSVAVVTGGIASSSTALRRWRRDGLEVHHVVDPRTGAPAAATWSLVTVAAATCAEANALATAAIVWGGQALFELPQRGSAARLVRGDGTVERVGGWPDEEVPRWSR